MASCGNSMSTTGPVTRAMRPTPPGCAVEAWASAVAVVMISISLVGRLLCRAQRVGSADDLGDLLGDLRLTGVVGEARVVGDELVGVVARRLHRLLRGRVLRRRRLQHGVEDAALDVDGKE